MPTIPSGLKPVVQGYVIGAPDGVHRSEVGGGRARYGMQWDRGVQQFGVTLILNALQFAIWTTFFHHSIKKGSISFTMDLNSGFGVQPHSVDMLPGSYSATPTGGGENVVWTVGFAVEAENAVYGMSAADAQAMLEFWEAGITSDLFERLAQFANVDMLVLS